jgi:hypothetical protein
MAAEHLLHMQKALDQMNLQIHRALNDITGVSGLRILDAILSGERNPLTLARLCHGGVKNSEEVIAKSLEGDYRPEHLFALRQSLAAFRYYQQLVLEADREIQLQLGELKTAATAQPTTPARTKANAHYVRWSRLFGQVFRVFKWKDYSVSGRGGGNVKIGFIDFQGLWEGRETVVSFSGLSIKPAFPRPACVARYAASCSCGRLKYT